MDIDSEHPHEPSARDVTQATTTQGGCAWQGCAADGEFKAPKNRHVLGTNSPDDYQFFCLDHIREHNRRWDYFDGMDQTTIERFQKDAIHGHRPTWKTGMPPTMISPEALETAFATFMGHEAPPNMNAPPLPSPSFTAEEHKAFAILDVAPESEWNVVKAKYKTLVKRLHPDVNNGDKKSEEQFKEVIAAYRCLEAYFTE